MSLRKEIRELFLSISDVVDDDDKDTITPLLLLDHLGIARDDIYLMKEYKWSLSNHELEAFKSAKLPQVMYSQSVMSY